MYKVPGRIRINAQTALIELVFQAHRHMRAVTEGFIAEPQRFIRILIQQDIESLKFIWFHQGLFPCIQADIG